MSLIAAESDHIQIQYTSGGQFLNYQRDLQSQLKIWPILCLSGAARDKWIPATGISSGPIFVPQKLQDLYYLRPK